MSRLVSHVRDTLAPFSRSLALRARSVSLDILVLRTAPRRLVHCATHMHLSPPGARPPLVRGHPARLRVPHHAARRPAAGALQGGQRRRRRRPLGARLGGGRRRPGRCALLQLARRRVQLARRRRRAGDEEGGRGPRGGGSACGWGLQRQQEPRLLSAAQGVQQHSRSEGEAPVLAREASVCGASDVAASRPRRAGRAPAGPASG